MNDEPPYRGDLPKAATLMEQLQARLLAKRTQTQATVAERQDGIEESDEQRHKRIYDDPACWTTVSAGNSGSILPR